MNAALLGTIVLTCGGFAVLLGFIAAQHRSRLAGGVAAAWTIEAARVSVLILEAVEVPLQDWAYLLLELSYLPLTWLLWFGTTEFTGKRLSGGWSAAYFVVSSLVVLGNRYLLATQLESRGLEPERADFWVTFLNLAVLFLPGAAIRFNLSYQFFRYWRKRRLLGALIAGMFGLPLAMGSLMAPFEWYLQYSGAASHLFWFVQILGLSVGVVILVLNQQGADLQAALFRVKTLRGMLPICAGCKKIRDDRGYWREVEAYIEKHSDAEFSHGICPDCMQRLYPDEANELRKQGHLPATSPDVQ